MKISGLPATMAWVAAGVTVAGLALQQRDGWEAMQELPSLLRRCDAQLAQQRVFERRAQQSYVRIAAKQQLLRALLEREIAACDAVHEFHTLIQNDSEARRYNALTFPGASSEERCLYQLIAHVKNSGHAATDVVLTELNCVLAAQFPNTQREPGKGLTP